MKNDNSQASSLERVFLTLEAIVQADGRSTISDIARELAIPVPTVHRNVQALSKQGFLVRAGRSVYLPGPRLKRLLGSIDDYRAIAAIAKPVLTRLAARVKSTVQLGTLENDMVTYRLKVGRDAGTLPTRVDMQLEAYCSAIGKILLASLPHVELDRYLASGPFVALTARTITEPDLLREELCAVERLGFAVDEGEIFDGLFCLAVPIRLDAGLPSASISISTPRYAVFRSRREDFLIELSASAKEIAETFSRVNGEGTVRR
jgi:DNA-binding IclR family transcriptional regulator